MESFLRIDGMHCASCEILIENVARKIEGIQSIDSSYATSTAKVVYDPKIISEDDLAAAIAVSGYKATLRSEKILPYDYRSDLLRLLTGVCLWGIVMMSYVAFFYPSNLGLVDPQELEPIRWLAFEVIPWVMFFATTVMIAYVGAPIFRGAWIGWRARVLNMDNLLVIAILAAYAFSIERLLAGSSDMYFDVACSIVAVVTVGRYFERSAKADATRELSKIMDNWAPKARIRWGGSYRLVDLDELEAGEHVVVHHGEVIPVDGVIIYGQGAVDESLMTGEPFPVQRQSGAEVLGGSVVVEGTIEIQVGEMVESQMNNLARILWRVQSGNSTAQRLADQVAHIFVPFVLALAGMVVGVSLLSGISPGAAVLAGLSTLIVSCPCTFGLATPLTTAIGISTALRQRIIVTSADAFDKAKGISIVAIDKTGTLSTGNMTVVEKVGSDHAIACAAAVERLSLHPIAKAIAHLDSSLEGRDIEIHPGKGAVAMVEGKLVGVGSKSLFATLGWDIPDDLAAKASQAAAGEGVASYLGWNEKARGVIVTRDRSRPEWQHVVDRLRAHCKVVLLTGAEYPSDYEAGFDEVFSGIPPEGKAAVIRQLRLQGTTVMVGDGSNDAPALAEADLGIAFGAPTTLAADAADVVIPGEGLDRIFTCFELFHTIRTRIRQNLGWALSYNAIAIPLAVLGLLNPLFAAVAMSSSSLLVVWNSTRPIKIPEFSQSDCQASDTTY